MDARAHYLLAQHREAQVGKGEAAGKLAKLSARGVSVFGRLVKGGIMELMILVAVVLAFALSLAVAAAVRGDAVEAARETESIRRVAAERQAAAAERAAAAAAATNQIISLNHDVEVMVKGYCVQIELRQKAEAALAAAKADAAAAARIARAEAEAAAAEAAVQAALRAFDLTIMWGQEVDEQRERAEAAEAALAAAKVELRNAVNLAAVRGVALGQRRK